MKRHCDLCMEKLTDETEVLAMLNLDTEEVEQYCMDCAGEVMATLANLSNRELQGLNVNSRFPSEYEDE